MTWRSKKDQNRVELIETFLASRAVGEWTREGSTLFFSDLNDIFNIRLFFEDDIDVIRQSTDLG